MMTRGSLLIAALVAATPASLAFQPVFSRHDLKQTELHAASSDVSRRDWIIGTAAASAGILLGSGISNPQPAQAIGPVKINLLNPTYSAVVCPKDRPIPGEKAMQGMRGLCVTVNVDLENAPEKTLEKVGVYGYISDKETGESVLANNPDGGSDAGQFAMVELVKTTDTKMTFEFIAAVPRELVRLGCYAGDFVLFAAARRRICACYVAHIVFRCCFLFTVCAVGH
jgi:hypothetical protein